MKQGEGDVQSSSSSSSFFFVALALAVCVLCPTLPNCKAKEGCIRQSRLIPDLSGRKFSHDLFGGGGNRPETSFSAVRTVDI